VTNLGRPGAGEAAGDAAMAARAQRLLRFGGTIRFGRLMRSDADLRLIDADPR
jgi:hypothetical protein